MTKATKAGRKYKKDEEKQTLSIVVRVSRREKELIVSFAKRYGISTSALIRQAVLTYINNQQSADINTF